MKLTKHPCDKMGSSAIEAFERIAVGDALPPMTKGVTNKLLAKGLIESGPPKELGDRLGKFYIPQYLVPQLVHMQWCEWCSEQPDNDIA